ncbi:MAG: group 1 glycosyl transferase [Deltaproteobacteria bacterium]|nr:MAG: group 1 glycosyl transferase [Deltaproteobacteria bacterium]
MLLRLLRATKEGPFESTVAVLADKGPVVREMEDLGVAVYSLGIPRGRISPIGAVRFLALVRRLRPALIQTWLYHADLVGVLLARPLGVRRVLWNLRSSYPDDAHLSGLTALVRRLCARLSPLPHAVVANSWAGMQSHRALGYRPRRWVVIPNGVDTERFRPDPGARGRLMEALGVKEGEVVLVGYVARFIPVKDHATFLEAASRVLRVREDIHFVLAGRGITWSNAFFARTIAPEFRARFHLLGETRHIEDVTPGLDIACSASLQEGFPNTVCEAMACGVPCVVTDVGDSCRIVGETGFVVPPASPEAMASAILRMAHMPRQERAALGERARRRAMERFEMSKVAKMYTRLYHEVLEGTAWRVGIG